jgi:hypothetical protein
MCEELLSPSTSLGLVRTSLTRYVLGSITSDLGLEEGLAACRFTRQRVAVTCHGLQRLLSDRDAVYICTYLYIATNQFHSTLAHPPEYIH